MIRSRHGWLWWLGFALFLLALALVGAVFALALHFQSRPAPLWIVLWVATLLAAVALALRRGLGAGLLVAASAVSVVAAWWGTIAPSNDRAWPPDVAELLSDAPDPADNDLVTLRHVRDFHWITPTQSEPVQATVHNVERIVKTAADAAQRTSRAAADAAARSAEIAADSLDAETIVSTTRESIAVATRTQQQAVKSMERAGVSMLTGLTEMQTEIAGFVSERIRQDLETQQELLRCRTFDEVREAQSRFSRTTFDQYSAEVSKLVQLSTQVLMRSLPPSRADDGAAGRQVGQPER